LWVKVTFGQRRTNLSSLLKYTIPSGVSNTFSETNIKGTKLMKLDTFYQFKEKAFCLWFVTSLKEESQWKIEIEPVMHFPKTDCENMLLVLESSPNLVKPQWHPTVA